MNFHHHPRRHLPRSSTNSNIIQSQGENFRENDGNDFGNNQNNSHRIVYHSIQIRGKSSMTCNPPTNNLLNSKSDIQLFVYFYASSLLSFFFVYIPTIHFLLYIFSEIKHRLLTMDLLNQMDKAKELTHFALTHQAISKEDKE